jgi:hypothetical protein
MLLLVSRRPPHPSPKLLHRIWQSLRLNVSISNLFAFMGVFSGNKCQFMFVSNSVYIPAKAVIRIKGYTGHLPTSFLFLRCGSHMVWSRHESLGQHHTTVPITACTARVSRNHALTAIMRAQELIPIRPPNSSRWVIPVTLEY